MIAVFIENREVCSVELREEAAMSLQHIHLDEEFNVRFVIHARKLTACSM